MEKLTQASAEILKERFGKDSLIALATVWEGRPQVRTVDAYYEDGAFYVVTNSRSGKMRQIAADPHVALSGDWFTAHGIGEDLGYLFREENKTLSKTLQEVFAAWLTNGHSDLSDETTVILKVTLTDGVLFDHGTRYDIDFT